MRKRGYQNSREIYRKSVSECYRIKSLIRYRDFDKRLCAIVFA